MSALHPLLRLSLWQIKNSLRVGLRSPPVWIPLLLAAIFLPGQIGGMLFSQTPLPAGTGADLGAHLDAVRAVVFLVLTLLALGYLDRGFAGGAFVFSTADVAVLFPAPFPRRLVLLFKLPSAILPLLSAVALVAWVFRLAVWLPIAQQRQIHGGGWGALLAAFLCVAGYLNLAATADLMFSLGRFVWARRVFLTLTLAAISAGGWLLWVRGIDALLALGRNTVLGVLFFPCRLAADGITAPLLGAQLSAGSWVLLVGWCALTLGLLLSRRENYYETAAVGAERVARVRQQMRSGNWAGANREVQRASRALTLPAFGQGAAALFWAHLAAALKRPWVNVGLPLGGGVAFALFMAVFVPHLEGGPPDAAGFLSILWVVTAYYLFYAVAMLGIPFYRRSLERAALIRPLPFPMGQVIAADVGSRALLGSLFFWGEGLALIAVRPPGTFTTVLALLFCLPGFVVCLNLLEYRLALAYPSTGDKVQALVAGLVQTFFTGLLLVPLLPFWFIPSALKAPGWAMILSLLLGLALIADWQFRGTMRAALAYEPIEDAPPTSFRQWVAEFRKGLTHPAVKRAIRPLIVIAIVVLLVGLVAARVNKTLHQPPPPPRTVAARWGDMVVKVSETGTVQPMDKVNVESKAPGRLLSIPIEEGQRVTKGQLIAVVDRSQLDPQIAGLRAQLSQAQAHLQQSIAQYQLQVQQSQRGIDQAEANLHTAQTHLAAVAAGARPQELAQQQQTVDRAQISLDDALRTLKRKQALVAKGFIAQSDADAAQVAVDTANSSLATAKQAQALTQVGPRIQDVEDAKAQVEAQRTALATARTNVGQNQVSQTEISQSRASMQQIQNQLAQLMVQLADTHIIAPASGIVLKKYKQRNEIVQSATTGFSDAQSLVATLGSRLEVQVGINEVDIPKVRLGASVVIHIDALPNVTYYGHVTEVAPASSNTFSDSGTSNSGTGSSISKFNVKVALDSYDARLRPGMTANVDIVSAKHPHAVLASLEALPGTSDHAKVTILTPAKTKEDRVATLGLRNDSDVEILHGVRAGEQIIVPTVKGSGRRKFEVGN